MSLEPSQIEILITRFIGNIFPGFYREYVFQLPINGHEQILEYGSGSGNCSIHLAKRLSNQGHLTTVDISSRWQREIQKRLKKTNNVSFKLGELEDFIFPECLFDCIFIHYVLHDIPKTIRKNKITSLTAQLKPGGKVFIKEPLNPNHGISEIEVRNLLTGVGLSEISMVHGKHIFAGKFFQAIYQK